MVLHIIPYWCNPLNPVGLVVICPDLHGPSSIHSNLSHLWGKAGPNPYFPGVHLDGHKHISLIHSVATVIERKQPQANQHVHSEQSRARQCFVIREQRISPHPQ